jgi:hypothetical protein
MAPAMRNFFIATSDASSALKKPALAATYPATSAPMPYAATLSVPGTKSA